MLLVAFAIQGRTVVVFPRFLRFFLRFLSEIEGVFPHFCFFVETPIGTSLFVQTFLEGLPFFFLKKKFFSKSLFFFSGGGKFF